MNLLSVIETIRWIEKHPAHLPKIPEKTIKIIMLNGRRVGPDAVVHDGARVALFPPIASG